MPIKKYRQQRSRPVRQPIHRIKTPIRIKILQHLIRRRVSQHAQESQNPPAMLEKAHPQTAKKQRPQKPKHMEVGDLIEAGYIRRCRLARKMRAHHQGRHQSDRRKPKPLLAINSIRAKRRFHIRRNKNKRPIPRPAQIRLQTKSLTKSSAAPLFVRLNEGSARQSKTPISRPVNPSAEFTILPHEVSPHR